MLQNQLTSSSWTSLGKSGTGNSLSGCNFSISAVVCLMISSACPHDDDFNGKVPKGPFGSITKADAVVRKKFNRSRSSFICTVKNLTSVVILNRKDFISISLALAS